jgi:hypothetical protein
MTATAPLVQALFRHAGQEGFASLATYRSIVTEFRTYAVANMEGAAC